MLILNWLDPGCLCFAGFHGMECWHLFAPKASPGGGEPFFLLRTLPTPRNFLCPGPSLDFLPLFRVMVRGVHQSKSCFPLKILREMTRGGDKLRAGGLYLLDLISFLLLWEHLRPLPSSGWRGSSPLPFSLPVPPHGDSFFTPVMVFLFHALLSAWHTFPPPLPLALARSTRELGL